MSEKPVQDKVGYTLPSRGVVFNDNGELAEMICRPKILPLKSYSLVRLEEIEKELEKQKK